MGGLSYLDEFKLKKHCEIVMRSLRMSVIYNCSCYFVFSLHSLCTAMRHCDLENMSSDWQVHLVICTVVLGIEPYTSVTVIEHINCLLVYLHLLINLHFPTLFSLNYKHRHITQRYSVLFSIKKRQSSTEAIEAHFFAQESSSTRMHRISVHFQRKT